MKAIRLSTFLNSTPQQFFNACCVKEAISNTFFLTKDTYADMVAAATGDSAKVFLVKNDENKGQEDTVYMYFPGTPGTVMWIAATPEII